MATSVLNPNAPIFVPSVYRAVEDFSDQWWDLVQASPYFRDYWLHECFSDPQIDSPSFLDDALIAADSVVVEEKEKEKEKERKSSADLVALGWLKWRKPRGEMEVPRYCDKAPKIVSMKVKPRSIQQPR